MRAWISGKVRFVYAGCGTSALSGLQNRANSKYCRGRVGLISVAHQAMLRLSSVSARFSAGFIVFNAYSTATIASHSGAMLSGVIPATFTRPEATAYTPNSSRRRSTCSFVRPLKENMPFCLMIKLKSRFAPFPAAY